MGIFDLLKDISLVLAGGLATFLAMWTFNRIQERKPVLVWRLLPAVSFTSQNITTFNLVIDNEGSKDAEDIRIVVSCPEDASIESFDIQSNEKAMIHNILKTNKNNEVTVELPLFSKGLDCVLSFLTKHLDPGDISVSVIGKDVVGQEKSIGKEIGGKFRRLFPFILILYFSILTVFTGYSIVVSLAHVNYLQQLDVADLYIRTGHPDLALAKYEKAVRDWWFPASAKLYYKIASAYARNNNASSAIHYLKKVTNDDPELIILIKTDKAFDPIKHSPEFTKFMKSNK